MIHHILLVSVSYLLVFCSIDAEPRKSSNIANKFEDEDDGEEDFSVSEVAELNEEFDELNELDPSTEIKH